MAPFERAGRQSPPTEITIIAGRGLQRNKALPFRSSIRLSELALLIALLALICPIQGTAAVQIKSPHITIFRPRRTFTTNRASTLHSLVSLYNSPAATRKRINWSCSSRSSCCRRNSNIILPQHLRPLLLRHRQPPWLLRRRRRLTHPIQAAPLQVSSTNCSRSKCKPIDPTCFYFQNVFLFLLLVWLI